jgi:dihydropteroate synthase
LNPALFHRWLQERSAARRPLVIGVLNVTPDSFSDGGKYSDSSSALEQVQKMVNAGADWIDCGAESTRPGADAVDEQEQIRRLEPVLGPAVRTFSDRAVFSIDTTRSAVAEFAIDSGVHIVNDISAGRDDPHMLPLAARRARPVLLMHMLGRPRDMQDDPRYHDVTVEVIAFLQARIAAAEAAGVPTEAILVDPGIGFGKTTAHNLELMHRLNEIVAIGRPVVVGTSRKRFIGQITGVTDPVGRAFGTAATVAWSIARGVAAVRVHDVAEMCQVVRMTLAMMHPSGQ